MTPVDPKLPREVAPTLLDATAGLPTEPELVDRRYRVIAPLGAGGFGRVDLVEDTANDNALRALKRLRREVVSTPRAVERFRGEIRALRELSHEGIPRIHNDGRTESGEAYFTMEYVEGPTLEELLAPDRCLSVLRACSIAREIACVLEYAHSKGVIHRDLKPSNVVLSKRAGKERVVVLDFGIAKLVEPDADERDSTPLATQPGLGTPQYMAPEQILGAKVDPATDLFALGVLLHRMLAGAAPWSTTRLRDAVLSRAPMQAPPLAGLGLPRDLARLVQSLLQIERERRPSLARVRSELDLVLERPARRRRSVWAACAALAVAAAAVTLAWPRRSPAATSPLDSSVAAAEDSSPALFADRVDPPDDRPEVNESKGTQSDESTSPSADPSGPTAALTFATASAPPDMVPSSPGANAGEEWPDSLVLERTGLELVRVREGDARIGARDFDPRAEDDERPARAFGVDGPVYLSRCEVTRAQYRAFCVDTGRTLVADPPWAPADDHPVVGVTWIDASAFAAWCEAELPSADLLEYTARCGAQTVYPWGNAPALTGAPIENLADQDFAARRKPLRSDSFAWSDGFAWTSPAGALGTNAWGYSDMLGNAAEWCADSSGNERVVYGGAWSAGISGARLSARASLPADSSQLYVGFRVAWRPAPRPR